MVARKKRKPARSARLLPAWGWWVLGVVTGIGIAMLIDIDGWYADKTQTRAGAQEAAKAAPPTKRNFDFYTLLPELEIIIPQEEIDPQGRRPLKPDSPPPTHQGGYLLQAGSFRHFNEADSLKARLALLGIEAHIQSVAVNNTKWHRVRIGPSNDRPALEQTRTRLRTHQIDTILMQAKQ